MAKTRVHELAKTYGIESKEVLEKLKEMGEFVKSPSSTIELPVEMKFKKQYGEALLASQGAATAAPGPEKATPKPAPAKAAADGPAVVETPAAAAPAADAPSRTAPKPGPKAPAAEPVVEAPAAPAAPDAAVLAEAPAAAAETSAETPAARASSPAPRPVGKPSGTPRPGNNPFAPRRAWVDDPLPPRAAPPPRAATPASRGRPPRGTARPRPAPECHVPTRR